MDGCAICGTTKPGGQGGADPLSFHVDHSHKTGEVRGLLCAGCNKGVGLLTDSPERCRQAWEYLKTSRGAPGLKSGEPGRRK
jgi:hypothetical protein